MTDPTDIVARIEATFPADYQQDFGEGDVFRLILDEEGPQALVQAVLDAAAPTPANEPHNQWTIDDGYLTDGDQLIDPHDTDAVLDALNAGSLDVTAPTGPTEPQCAKCGGTGRWTHGTNNVGVTSEPCPDCVPTGATGHDTPAPTAEHVRTWLGDHRDWDESRLALDWVTDVLAAVEALSGRTATPDPVVEVSSGSENRHAMKHLPPDQDPVLPPGVERDGDGWKLRKGSLYPAGWAVYRGRGRWIDVDAWDVNYPTTKDVPVRPVASITEEPTDG